MDDTIAAVLIEPVQGFQGARSATVEYLQAARALCDQYGAKLLFDEVQCGVGRTGNFFGYQTIATAAKPDALSNRKPAWDAKSSRN